MYNKHPDMVISKFIKKEVNVYFYLKKNQELLG